MRKIVLVLLSLVIFSGTAFAAEAKIGVFHMPQVVMQTNAFKDSQKKIQNSYSAEQTTLEKQETALKKKFDDFAAQQSALSVEAKETRQLALTREKRDFEDKVVSFRRKVGAAENKSANELNVLIFITVSEYGKQNKFTYILDLATAGAVYYDSSLDINKEILDAVNKMWKDKPKIFTDALAKSQASLSQ